MYTITKTILNSLTTIGLVVLLTGCGATLVNTVNKDSLMKTTQLLDERLSKNRYKKNDFGSSKDGKDFLSITIDKGYEDLAIKIVQEKIMSSKGGYSFSEQDYKKSITSKAISNKMFELIKVLHSNGWIGNDTYSKQLGRYTGNYKMKISIADYNKLVNVGNKKIANYYFININNLKYSVESRYSLDKNKVNKFTQIIDLVLNTKDIDFNNFIEKIISKNISTGDANDENLIMVTIQHLLKNGYIKEAVTVANIATKYDKKAKYYDVEKKFLKPFISNLKVFNIFYKYYSNPKRGRYNYSGQFASLDIGLEASITNNSLEPLKIYEKNHGTDNLSNFLDTKRLLKSIKDEKFVVINYLLSKNIDFSKAEKVLTSIIDTKNKKLLSKIDEIEKLPPTFITLKKSGITFSEIPSWLNAEFSLKDSGMWAENGFNLETAKAWNKHISYANSNEIARLGLYKKMGITNPERATIYLKYKISEKQVIKIDRGITNQCGNNILSYIKLKEMNPYEAKNKCFWFDGKRYNTISKNRGLYSARSLFDTNIYVDIKFKNYATGRFAGVVKGTGVTDLEDGSKIPKTKVIEALK